MEDCTEKKSLAPTIPSIDTELSNIVRRLDSVSDNLRSGLFGDCAETFAIIASEIQVVRNQLVEMRDILEPQKDSEHNNTKSPQH